MNVEHVCKRRESVELVNFYTTLWNRSQAYLAVGHRVYKLLYRLKFRAVDVG